MSLPGAPPDNVLSVFSHQGGSLLPADYIPGMFDDDEDDEEQFQKTLESDLTDEEVHTLSHICTLTHPRTCIHMHKPAQTHMHAYAHACMRTNVRPNR